MKESEQTVYLEVANPVRELQKQYGDIVLLLNDATKQSKYNNNFQVTKIYQMTATGYQMMQHIYNVIMLNR